MSETLKKILLKFRTHKSENKKGGKESNRNSNSKLVVKKAGIEKMNEGMNNKA